MLNDVTIRNLCEQGAVDPFDLNCLSAASYDCKLAPVLKYQFTEKEYKDNAVGYKTGFKEHNLHEKNYIIRPLEFALAATFEKISIPDNLCGFIAGKSTIARNGLIVESAGLLDPGFSGDVVLELFNQSRWPLYLKHKMKIAQLYFLPLNSPATDFLYSKVGNYNLQTGVQEPRYRLDDPNWRE